MSVNCLTAGGQNVATDLDENITTLATNLRPSGSTTAMYLTWDSDNKLRSADIDANGTADLSFQYDALGRRVARTGTGGSVVYVQIDQQTIADYPVGSAATTPTFRYVYASYIDEPVVRKRPTSTSTVHFYHLNHQYSVTAITTSTGTITERYAYTAYGQPTVLDASASVLSSSAVCNTSDWRTWIQTDSACAGTNNRTWLLLKITNDHRSTLEVASSKGTTNGRPCYAQRPKRSICWRDRYTSFLCFMGLL